MSRQVTQLELMLICLICLLGIVLTGCVTKQPRRTYPVQGFTLVVMEQQQIRELYKMMYGIDHPFIQGYCDQKARVMYVSYAGDKPRFETLGHEVWHLDELGGRWHE